LVSSSPTFWRFLLLAFLFACLWFLISYAIKHPLPASFSIFPCVVLLLLNLLRSTSLRGVFSFVGRVTSPKTFCLRYYLLSCLHPLPNPQRPALCRPQCPTSLPLVAFPKFLRPFRNLSPTSFRTSYVHGRECLKRRLSSLAFFLETCRSNFSSDAFGNFVSGSTFECSFFGFR